MELPNGWRPRPDRDHHYMGPEGAQVFGRAGRRGVVRYTAYGRDGDFVRKAKSDAGVQAVATFSNLQTAIARADAQASALGREGADVEA